MAFFGELVKRHVPRATVVYLVVAWVVLQVADVLLPALRLPDWSMTLVAALAILGIPVVIALSWALDVGRQGISKSEGRGSWLHYASFAAVCVVCAGLLYRLAQPEVAPGQDLPVQEAPTAAATEPAAESPKPEPAHHAVTAIAVLPFRAASTREEDRYFAEGLADTLIHTLTTVQNIEVTARTSSFRFRDGDFSLEEIAGYLKVGSLLQGSVQRSGDQLRIIATLVDTRSGQNRWSQTFDRPASDLFAVQDEIAQAVVETMRVTWAGAQQRTGLTDPLDQERYFEALHALALQTSEGTERAETLLSQVIADAPGFAPAYVALGRVRWWQKNLADRSFESLDQEITRLLDQALALEPNLASAHHLRGRVAMERGELDAADSQFQRALELAPSDPGLIASIGELETLRDDWTGARSAFERAHVLDPLNSYALISRAMTVIVGGDLDEGLELLATGLDSELGQIGCMSCLATWNIVGGRKDTGWYWIHRLREEDPEALWLLIIEGQFALEIGDMATARAVLEEAEGRAPESDLVRNFALEVLVASGDLEGMREVLDRFPEATVASASRLGWESYRLAGCMALQLNEPKRAARLFEIARSPVQGARPRTQIGLAADQAYAQLQAGDSLGAKATAIGALERGLALRESGMRLPAFQFKLGRLYSFADEPELAMAEFIESVEAGYRLGRATDPDHVAPNVGTDLRYRSLIDFIEADLGRMAERIAQARADGDWEPLRQTAQAPLPAELDW